MAALRTPLTQLFATSGLLIHNDCHDQAITAHQKLSSGQIPHIPHIKETSINHDDIVNVSRTLIMIILPSS
jgi:hypothetical protein